MVFHDLTHPIDNKIPVFPGESQPAIREMADIDREGYRAKWLEMGSHTGTHIDAPAHLLTDGKTLDQYPVSHFCGSAVIIPVPAETRQIKTTYLQKFGNKIAESEFVLLNTGWSRFWDEDKYFRDYPILSEEAARWLTLQPLKGIGVDAISVDPVDSVKLPVHHIILRAGFIMVENLTFPEELKAETIFFQCLPLYLADADGSPVRAIAIEL